MDKYKPIVTYVCHIVRCDTGEVVFSRDFSNRYAAKGYALEFLEHYARYGVQTKYYFTVVKRVETLDYIVESIC